MRRLYVIIPVYNAEKYIKYTVESVLKKSGDISIVLVNDGSKDASAAICDQLGLEHPCIHVIHQENGGVSKARNAGIEYVIAQSQGEEDYIAFLDADDFWCEEFNLSSSVEDNADIYAFSTLLSNEKGTSFKFWQRQKDEVKVLPGANPQWLCRGVFAACLYRVELIRKYHLRFMVGVKADEDMIFWNQANFCAKKIVFSSDAFYVYRSNSKSATHTSHIDTENALHVPRAWHKAREWIHPLSDFTEQEKEKWCRKCDTIVGPAILDCAVSMAKQGFSPQQIQDVVMKDPLSPYVTALNPDKLNEPEKERLLLFRKDIRKFARHYKRKGNILNFVYMISRLPLIRSVYEWIRYR